MSLRRIRMAVRVTTHGYSKSAGTEDTHSPCNLPFLFQGKPKTQRCGKKASMFGRNTKRFRITKI